MTRPVVERIYANVDMPDGAFGCWVWLRHLDRPGYGRITVKNRPQLAHRVAYELLVGPIPAGLTLDHLCRNRACVNPGHLEPVTAAENNLRGTSPMAENARKTRCIHGHELVRRGNRRHCRTCEAAATARYKSRLRRNAA